jgi:alkyl sulfatase BDS1-like metallo-beta-lactamase superfamily hydrolase
MGVKFLSDDHFTTATTALNGNDAFVGAIANIDMGMQFHVTDAPEGDIDFFLSVGDGAAEMASGVLDDADVTITSTHETALAMFKGDLNTQMAFMTGKIKVAGNMAVLMMNQGVINQWAATVAKIDVEA